MDGGHKHAAYVRKPLITHLLGYSVEEAMAKPMEEIFSPASFDLAMKVLSEEMALEHSRHKDLSRSRVLEVELFRKDGSIIPVEIGCNFLRDPDGRPVEIVAVARDISERKHMERALGEKGERYRYLVENIGEAIYSIDDNGVITYISPAVQSITGHSPHEVVGHAFAEFIHPEDIGRVLDHFQRTLLVSVEPIECRLLTKSGEVKWIHASSRPAVTDNRIAGVHGMLEDITDRVNADEVARQSFDKLQKALQGTIQIMSSIVELRDPYTAGHQLRVTKLACAIARELNLPADKIDGISVAGLVHDIGKIYVPAEILSKPSSLTEVELIMIRTHPKVGHDLLKQIEFPWPVAEIVLQHHERMDGSGYPSGLCAQEILIEARVLGVADVVEAMSSHRPYRPALGIGKALKEITMGSGILYDQEVVDACLCLFTENRFKFK